MHLILKNARLVTMEEGSTGYTPTKPCYLLIRSGLIVAIGEDLSNTLRQYAKRVVRLSSTRLCWQYCDARIN